MDTSQTILAVLGGQAIVLAVGGWLARSFLTQVLAREMERFRAELSRETALSIERIKHDLQIQAHQKQTMFVKIHELRLDAVAKLYSGLLDLSDAASVTAQDDVQTGSPEWKERYVLALTAMQKFRTDVRLLKLYLPRPAAEQVTAIADRIEGLLVAVGVNASGTKTTEHWHRFDDQLRRILPIARTVLENEFQALLGVTSEA